MRGGDTSQATYRQILAGAGKPSESFHDLDMTHRGLDRAVGRYHTNRGLWTLDGRPANADRR